jgi:Tol biopolymer transport system component
MAFMSHSTNLVSGITNQFTDVFVRDLMQGETSRVSVDSDGVEGNEHSAGPSLSADGRYVVFISSATNLVEGDTNGAADVFRHDRQTGVTVRVSVDSNEIQANDDSHHPTVSSDGRYVAFRSMATNLVTGDTNGDHDIFVRDVQLGTTARVSVTGTGAQANSSASDAMISADGRYVSFYSDATNLVFGDTNATTDVFITEVP